MIVRTFQPRFAPLVENGTKKHTVRLTPKRMPKVGQAISLRKWSGLPYRSKQVILRESVITKIERIRITFRNGKNVIFINDKALDRYDADRFARNDGFECIGEMFKWFGDVHGLPFAGIVIHWK